MEALCPIASGCIFTGSLLVSEVSFVSRYASPAELSLNLSLHLHQSLGALAKLREVPLVVFVVEGAKVSQHVQEGNMDITDSN